MRLLNLKSAAVEIRQALDQREIKEISPFFFMVGAGISHPPLPLAAKIQDDCKEEALRYGKPSPESSAAPIDSYSHWFEQAYPHPQNRQQFLRKVMENAVISRANFRLAHLLLEKTVTNLVVTTNFDDFLSRALTLFGRRHIVCDHPRTLERIDLRSQEVQIIHIHGSYWFYDCCNLKGEIAERAKSSESTSFTMLSMLDDILWTHSPLVVGYSGWEGDVFMNALRRRLSSGLRTNLYWFCYRRRDVRSLPEWLTSHSNVHLVVPDEPETELLDVPSSMAGSAIATREKGGRSTSGMDRDEPLLQATAVFDELIRSLRLDVPALTKDPLGFFTSHLTKTLLGDSPEELENDVYAIRGVIKRLDKLREQEKQLPPPSIAESLVESFRNAVRQSNHREAIRVASGIPLGELTAEQLREVASALSNAALALDDNSDEELKSYDLNLVIAGKLEALGHNDLSIKDQTATALFNKGVALSNINRNEDAIATYGEVLQRFGDATEPALREQVASSLLNRSLALGALHRNEDALAVYDDILRRFGDAMEPELREQVAKALANKGFVLCDLNRNEDAITAYDEMLLRFADATEPALREVVAMGLRNRGIALGALKRNEDALAAYDDVLRRFGDAMEPKLREQVAKALINKGFLLGVLKRHEEAITACDEVLLRFGDATEPVLRDQVAKALFNKGVRLGALNRSKDAIAAYDEVLKRFGNATEPALRETVAKAKAAREIARSTSA